MGWNATMKIRARVLGVLAAVVWSMSLVPTPARAQDVGTGDDLYRGLSNNYLYLLVGVGDNVAGGIALATLGGNTPDARRPLLITGPIRPANNAPDFGTRIYVRVDGGSAGNGLDYIFGDQQDDGDGTDGGNGTWVQPPTVIGNRLVARWRTLPTEKQGTGGGGTGGGGGVGGGGGGGGSTTVTIDHRIEIEMIASFVHDTLRLQFNITNRNPGRAHNVGLVMVQNIVAAPNTSPANLAAIMVGGATPPQGADGPLRIPNYPYLRRETVLSGGLVPSTWETFHQIAAATQTAPAAIHSIRGTLRPFASAQSEPTPPTRFAYARIERLNGYNPAPPPVNGQAQNPIQHDFQQIWNYTPDNSILLTSPVQAPDAGVALYWSEQIVPASATRTIVTLIGRSTTDNDFTPPLSLSVSAPSALGFRTDRNNNQGLAVPNPFQVTAYASNLTDLLPTGGLNVGPVNFSINLPQGLALAPNETMTKQLDRISPGAEGSVSWNVVPTGEKTGTLRFAVSVAGNLGSGKTVTRDIEVPAPPAVELVGTTNNPLRLYQMLSFPLVFGNARPSTILGLRDNPPDFQLVRYNPVAGQYEPVNTFEPGFAYWFLSNLPDNVRRTINPAQYPPLANQMQPNADTFRVNYPRGWNQIGNPYVYGIRFSEIQVFDQETFQIYYLSEAADNLRRWVSPAIYRWNPITQDYDLLDNFGYVMQPYEGYWIRVLRPGLTFIYPGADAPGGSVTRSVLAGSGPGATLGRATVDNWRLRIAARSASGNDLSNYIGVAPRAIDGMDIYKYDKPPVIHEKLTLDIVRTEGPEAGTRLAQDLRAPVLSRKVWDLVVRSPRAGEEVTLSWPEIAASVPRQYQLTLIDLDTGARRNLRNTSAYVFNTGTGGTRRLQIIAEPVSNASRVQITAFDVVPNRTRGRAETSVAINYTLSQPAEARVIIRDGRGRTVRNLAAGSRAADSGNNGSVIWDLRDQQGVSLPGGVYNVELIVIGESGQTTRQVRPYILTR